MPYVLEYKKSIKTLGRSRSYWSELTRDSYKKYLEQRLASLRRSHPNETYRIRKVR